MATIKYLYRSKKGAAKLTLRLTYTDNGSTKRIDSLTSIFVEKLYWDKQHFKTNLKFKSLAEKQQEINDKLSSLQITVFKQFEVMSSDDISKEWLKQVINNFYNPVKKVKFNDELLAYFDFFLKEKANEITHSSVKKYTTVRNLVERYQNATSENILIKDVDMDFKNKFVQFCKSKKYAPNSIAWSVRSIKTVCNHAKYNGVEISYQLDKLTLKTNKVDNVYLTFEDISAIQNINKSKLTESLENARDWLIISCYTGQRISDFMRFDSNMIREEKETQLLEFIQEKTKKNMTLPLFKEVLEILDKREGEFPRAISHQKYNDYIKVVCEIAKLNDKVEVGKKEVIEVNNNNVIRKVFKVFEKWEVVSSHIGRRSFASNYYGKLPTPYLMYITGHQTEKMLLTYIGKSDKSMAFDIMNYMEKNS